MQLTGVHAGQVLSSEITLILVPTLWLDGEGNIGSGVISEPFSDLAESETLCMCGNFVLAEQGRTWLDGLLIEVWLKNTAFLNLRQFIRYRKVGVKLFNG